PAHATVHRDLLEQRVAAEPALLRDPLERGIDLDELGTVEDVAPIRERIQRLDAARAPSDDADGPRGSDGGGGRIPAPLACIDRPPGALPAREHTAPLGERAARGEALVLEERGDSMRELQGWWRVVRDLEGGQSIRPPHDAQADLASGLGRPLD